MWKKRKDSLRNTGWGKFPHRSGPAGLVILCVDSWASVLLRQPSPGSSELTPGLEQSCAEAGGSCWSRWLFSYFNHKVIYQITLDTKDKQSARKKFQVCFKSTRKGKLHWYPLMYNALLFKDISLVHLFFQNKVIFGLIPPNIALIRRQSHTHTCRN